MESTTEAPARQEPGPCAPHGYHDAERIRAELAAAGFPAVAVERVEFTSVASAARDVAIAYCQGTPLRAEIEARDAAGLEAATAAATEALAQRFGPGPISGLIKALVITAQR